MLSMAVATCEGHGHGCPTAKVIREVQRCQNALTAPEGADEYDEETTG